MVHYIKVYMILSKTQIDEILSIDCSRKGTFYHLACDYDQEERPIPHDIQHADERFRAQVLISLTRPQHAARLRGRIHRHIYDLIFKKAQLKKIQEELRNQEFDYYYGELPDNIGLQRPVIAAF